MRRARGPGRRLRSRARACRSPGWRSRLPCAAALRSPRSGAACGARPLPSPLAAAAGSALGLRRRPRRGRWACARSCRAASRPWRRPRARFPANRRTGRPSSFSGGAGSRRRLNGPVTSPSLRAAALAAAPCHVSAAIEAAPRAACRSRGRRAVERRSSRRPPAFGYGRSSSGPSNGSGAGSRRAPCGLRAPPARAATSRPSPRPFAGSRACRSRPSRACVVATASATGVRHVTSCCR